MILFMCTQDNKLTSFYLACRRILFMCVQDTPDQDQDNNVCTQVILLTVDPYFVRKCYWSKIITYEKKSIFRASAP